MADIGTAYVRIAPNMSGIQGKIAGGFRGAGGQIADQMGGEISAKQSVIMGAIAGVAAAAANKAMNLITSSIGDAVRRVDTLNSAQKTFQYMGFAATDSAQAVKAVTKSIEGLPTPLDGAVRGMTALAATYGDVKLGQRVFTALNDAILGFGGSAAMVDNAIQQVSQLPLDGPLDAQTWNSLRNSGLTPVLVAMGKDMGRSVSQLKADFGSGKLTVQDFVNELTKLDTQGGGGLVKLSDIAQNATSGIQTGMSNMQTAVARGMASIIQSIGQKNISSAISSIGAAFESALKGVSGGIVFISQHKDIFAPIAVGIGAIVTAMTVWAAVTKIMTIAQAVFNAVMAANPITLIAYAIIGLVAGLIYFFTQTKLGKQVWSDFTGFLMSAWEGLKSGFAAVSTFFQGIWNSISSGVNAFLSFFSEHWRIIIAIVLGPLGLLIDFVTAYWSQITGAISTAVNFISNIIRGVFNAVVGFLVAVFSPIIGVYASIFGTVYRVIASAVSSVWGVVTGTFNSVVGFLGGVAGRIIGVFAGAGSWLYNAGRNVVQGLLNGISGLAGSIGSFFLSRIPGWIVGPFKKALGIASPSKVFAGFGDNISQGLINGIAGGQSGVKSAIGDITDAALAPITAGINPSVAFGGSVNAVPAGSAGGNSTTQTVTIGSVSLGDQSAVQEFFKQLNQDTANVGKGFTPNQGAI